MPRERTAKNASKKKVAPRPKAAASTFSQRDGHWVLEAYFREMGTFQGSNHAVFERFKQVELPRLRAKALVDLKTDLRG